MPHTLQLLTRQSLEVESYAPTRWLWEDYLATGMVALLTSRWKAGKTTLTTVLLSRLGSGGTLAGSQVAPASAIVLTEEPPVLWQERHRRLNFPESVRLGCRPFNGRPTPEQWSDLVDSLVAEAPDLVVFDPLAMFLPGSVENNAGALLAALEPLRRLTSAGAAVLLVHHPKKGGSTDELSPRGSGALTGFVDILIDLHRPADSLIDDRRRRIKTSSRLRPSTAKMIELNPDGRDYTLLPHFVDGRSFEAGWPILKMVLEDSDCRPTRARLLKYWPRDFDKPSRATLIRWLERAQNEGLIERRGTGRHHDAFEYCLPGQKFMFDDMTPLPPLEPLHPPYREPQPKKTMKELVDDVKKGMGAR